MTHNNNMNHNNMTYNNNMNQNAIGNDVFNNQRVNDQCVDHNNVIFNKPESQGKTQDLSSYQNQSISINRNVDNTPAWINKKDSPSKKARMFTLNETLLNVGSAPNLRAMPLSLDNGLPAAVLRFGTL